MTVMQDAKTGERVVFRYPKTGERYKDWAEGHDGEVWVCDDERNHGPGKCFPDDHEILGVDA